MPNVIAFCLDEGFSYPTSIALYSLLKNTKSELEIHIFGYELSEKTVGEFNKIAGHFGKKLNHYSLSSDDIILPKHNLEHISGASFLRLLLPKYLSGRVTYLDGDILVRQDISGLMNAPLGSRIIAASSDANTCYYKYLSHHLQQNPKAKSKIKPTFQKRIQRAESTMEFIGTDDPTTIFNAGIYSIDFDKLKADKKTYRLYQNIEKAIEIGEGRDQIFLNWLFHGQTKIMPMKWNAQLRNAKPSPKFLPLYQVQNWSDARNDPAIVHFVSNRKPWHPIRKSYSWSNRTRILEYRSYMSEVKAIFGLKYKS